MLVLSYANLLTRLQAVSTVSRHPQCSVQRLDMGRRTPPVFLTWTMTIKRVIQQLIQCNLNVYLPHKICYPMQQTCFPAQKACYSTRKTCYSISKILNYISVGLLINRFCFHMLFICFQFYDNDKTWLRNIAPISLKKQLSAQFLLTLSIPTIISIQILDNT